uniref:Uncharacterized protein n=1 Tax=Arachis duranensis TaxID=130453 RepID=N1NJJ6_ARADU|nr:hypothetical protein ARAX_ADH035P21-018 [Arachis duranensis]
MDWRRGKGEHGEGIRERKGTVPSPATVAHHHRRQDAEPPRKKRETPSLLPSSRERARVASQRCRKGEEEPLCSATIQQPSSQGLRRTSLPVIVKVAPSPSCLVSPKEPSQGRRLDSC